jgi:hypothetical protein
MYLCLSRHHSKKCSILPQKVQSLKLDTSHLYSHLMTVPGIGVCLHMEGAAGLSVGITSCALGTEVGEGAFAGSTNCPASYTCMYGYGS